MRTRRSLAKVVVLAILLSTIQVIASPNLALASAGPKGSLQFDGPHTNGQNIRQVQADGVTAPLLGAFTYEAWFYTTQSQVTGDVGANVVQTIIGTRSPSGGGSAALDITVVNGRVDVSTGAAGLMDSGAGSVVANTWYHFAYVRKQLPDLTYQSSLYLDGVLKAYLPHSPAIDNGSQNSQTSTRVIIGRKGDNCCDVAAEEFKGYISNIRVSNAAEYTAAFSRPTGPLTATASTQLLLNTTNDGNFVTNTGTKTGVTISVGTDARYTGANVRIYPVSSSEAPPFGSPSITSLSVTSGPFAGGTVTTLTGTNLSSTIKVMVGTETATSLTINSSSSVTFTTPTGTLGTKVVVVSTMLGDLTVTGGFTYLKTAQTVNFTTVPTMVSGESKFLAATATSGLTVSFTSNTSGICTVSGDKVTATGDGTCSLTATQAGDPTYESASATITFTVTSTARNNDEQDALVLALAGVAVGVASMMADVTTIATNMKSCYRGKITKKVMKNKACPKGYSTKKLKVSGS